MKSHRKTHRGESIEKKTYENNIGKTHMERHRKNTQEHSIGKIIGNQHRKKT